MQLVTVKLIVLAISGLVRIKFGMIPIVMIKILSKRWSKEADHRMKKVISVLMFFGGGVLLATTFLHMMPDVRDKIREAEPDLELPLSEIIFLVGFFLVYMIEDIVHSIIHQRRSRKDAKEKSDESNINANQSLPGGTAMMMVGEDKGLHNNDDTTINVANANGVNAAAGFNGILPSAARPVATNSHSLSLSSVQAEHRAHPNQLRETKEIFRKNSTNGDEIPGLAKSRCQDGMGGITNGAFVSEKFQYYDSDWMRDIVNNGNSAAGLPRGRRSICNELILANACSEVKSAKPVGSEEQGYNTRRNNHHRHNHSEQNNSKSETNNNAHLHAQHSSQKTPSHNHNHSHMPLNLESEYHKSVGSEIRNILIVVAISFHGIFEGMAIGLQGTEKDVWYLFLAVSLHECTILFCIGVELISSNTKVFRMVLYILIVSLVSPVGIAIGIIISEKAYGELIHQALIVGSCQGLAAGTLLYVTFFEIFQEEGKKLHRKCYHILVAVLGFMLMGSLEFMGGHHHGEKQQSGPGSNSSTGHAHSEAGHNHSHDHDH